MGIGDIGVGRRLGASYLVLTGLIVTSAATGWWGLQQQATAERELGVLERVRDDIQAAKYNAADVTGWQGLFVADVGAFGFAYATGPDGYNRQGELKAKDAVYAGLAATRTGDMTPAERAEFAKLKPAWDDFFAWDATVVEWLSADTKAARAKAMTSINGGEASAAYSKVLDITAALDESVNKRADMLRAEVQRVHDAALTMLGAALALAVVLAALMSTWVTRSIIGPLTTVVAALRRLADRDLTVRVELNRRDELGRLGDALNQTAESLRETLSTIAGHAGNASDASNITGVATAVGATTTVANRAQSNAETLARTSTELRELVAAFKL